MQMFLHKMLIFKAGLSIIPANAVSMKSRIQTDKSIMWKKKTLKCIKLYGKINKLGCRTDKPKKTQEFKGSKFLFKWWEEEEKEHNNDGDGDAADDFTMYMFWI